MLEFKIPEVGENITTGTVIGVSVSVGDTVSVDQDLLELETEKASLPIPSPVDGVIKEILIKEGDEVKIGQVVMKIDAEATTDEAPKDEQTAAAKQAASATEAPQPTPTPPTPVGAMTIPPSAQARAQKDVPAAPTVRRLAREVGLAISQVPGSGPGGRISKDDVKKFAKQLITSMGAGVAAAPLQKPLPDFSKWGGIKREPMNNIRKKTAEHLSLCWGAPHVTQFDKADITELEKLRKEHSTKNLKLTITPFLLKVMAEALKEFPKFNASIDLSTNEIIYKDYFHIGIAVDTERGLLVPIVRDVDKKNIKDIACELNEMAERARNKKTRLDELQGASMTLTNLGGIGGHAFTPIVNWPEVCILGVSRGGLEPAFDKGEKRFTPRFKLPLSLSYDHRLIDGADAARFARYICEAIEQTSQFKLE